MGDFGLGVATEQLRYRWDGFTPEKQRLFLEALATSGCVRDACRAAGVSNNTAYRTRRRLAAFARDWDMAQRQAASHLELIAYERATIGAEEVTTRNGAVVQTRRKPSDAMLRLLLQASNPAKFGRTMGRGGGDPAKRKALLRKTMAAIAQMERERLDEARKDWEKKHGIGPEA